MIHQFGFQSVDKAFDDGIVPAVPPAAHTRAVNP
jgi:hypothetical protein